MKMVQKPERDAPKRNYEDVEPKFRNESELSPEQLNDPDYRLKKMQKLNRGGPAISCSKCHHCR